MRSKDSPVCLQDPAAFFTTIRTKKGRLYVLHATNLRPAMDRQLFATLPELSIHSEYADLARIISKDEAKGMPNHSEQDLAIN